MSAPAVETIDASALPRPGEETEYERGLVSDYHQLRCGHQVMRRKGTLTSYLTYTVSGRGYFRDDDDRAIVVGKGDFVLIDSHAYQEYGTWPRSQSWKVHWVNFDVQPHWHPWLPLSTSAGLNGVSFAHVSSRALRRQVSDLFFELHVQRARSDAWCHALCLNLLERILILAHGSGEAPRQMDPRISRVLQAIGTNSAEPPTADELSALAGLSPSRLAYLFRQQTGSSILGAVNRARLRAAQHALQEPGVSLSEVAERSGFQSPYSFSNWYLQQTGLRPGAYRRKWLAKASPPRSTSQPWIRASWREQAGQRG